MYDRCNKSQYLGIQAVEDSIMEKKNIKKIVLAYSGGLDTSIIIPWL